ncbi:MAG: ribonuclease Z [Chloroflexota bacterium]|nr:ribonuclease Z [Chloroflexota bacterium]
MIDLTLVGTGAMSPLPDRWLSSLLVRVRGELILFDCGEGTQISLKRIGWGFRRIAAICFSHHHADHTAGLPGLLHTIANADRTDSLLITGPPGTREVVAGLRVIAPDLPFPVEVRELEGGDSFILPVGLRGTVVWGEHRIPCLIYRADLPRARRFDADLALRRGIPQHFWRRLQAGESVTWEGGAATSDDVLGPQRRGLSFGYVTDTRPSPMLATFFTGVDLLICEGTYGDNGDHAKAIRNMHMTFAEAATIARDAQAGQLWLTHFSPAMIDPAQWLPNAQTIFPATFIGSVGTTSSLVFPNE